MFWTTVKKSLLESILDVSENQNSILTKMHVWN